MPWFGTYSASSGKGYSLFTILAAVLSTMALTSTLAAILTHAFITGRVALPPGLSNLASIIARVLPGTDYRSAPMGSAADDEHRGDWTWAQPVRRDTQPPPPFIARDLQQRPPPAQTSAGQGANKESVVQFQFQFVYSLNR